MKRYISFITISLFCFLIIANSCSGNENLPEKAKPGSYTIEKVLHIIEGETGSRAIKPGNDEFDIYYDHNYVYLHVVGSEDYAFLPIDTMNCGTEKECYGFSYHININEDGSAIVTPILSDGTLSKDVLTIEENSACYFSSEKESVWQLDGGQIFRKSDHFLYKYKDDENDMCDNNKEIYRSITNFSITELSNNYDDIIMERTCAAFAVFGLFYDGEELDNNPFTDDDIVLEEGEFERTMQSELENWFIKLYIGGQAFVPRYDIGTKSQPMEDIIKEEKENDNRNKHKYYSTGIFSAEYNNHKFQKLTLCRRIGSGPYSYKGMGYYTPRQIRLLAPVIQKELNVYVLIKKWDNNSTEDFEQWLANDSNALYTKVDISGYTIPENNCFYTMGMLMDIRQFKKAWDAAQTSPASRTANGMHYFELKDAKVIIEKH